VELIPEQQQLVAIRCVLTEGFEQILVETCKPLTALTAVAEFCVRRTKKRVLNLQMMT